MDGACVYEQKTVIHELTQGLQMAKQLRVNLNSAEAREFLIQKILSSYDKALYVLKCGDSTGKPQTVAPPMPSLPESSISIESPRSREFGFDKPFFDQQDQKVLSKKRKAPATFQDQIRIRTDNGLEGNMDDGYSWRKYGQKDIFSAKFPRSYYRCTHRNVQNCLATKQVQRTDEDPTVFEITYKGKHTCNNAAQSASPLQPSSPEKHEIKQTHHHHQPSSPDSVDIPPNLRSNLSVNTSDLDDTVPSSFSFPSTPFEFIEDYEQLRFPYQFDDELLQGYSPPFISPATHGSSYMTDWGNSPSLDFLANKADLDTNFEFNNSSV